jgi:hypothetical protein
VSATEPALVPLYKVVYDSRFAESVAFARRTRRLGFAIQAIEGDMTRFWYDDLYHRWRRGFAAVAGLTAHGPMFCFERLAWDQGMRIVFRAEHKPAGAGRVEHAITGPIGMLSGSADLSAAGQSWAERMADVVTHCPAGRFEISSATVSTQTTGFGADAESLYSWVIAPAGTAFETA